MDATDPRAPFLAHDLDNAARVAADERPWDQVERNQPPTIRGVRVYLTRRRPEVCLRVCRQTRLSRVCGSSARGARFETITLRV